MPKVSVIIPVYGVERYIEQCARSLFEQTLDDVEYIFIDDCTLDDSIGVLRRVIEDYPKRRGSIKILRNATNLGQGQTRTNGIDAATGDFVIHCDPDDWVEHKWLESLYNYAIDNKHDLVWCDYYRYKTDDSCCYVNTGGKTDFSSVLKSLVSVQRIGSLWGSLVRRDIVQDKDVIRPTWNYAEDVALIAQYSALAKSMGHIDQALYYYRLLSTSISHSRLKRQAIVDGLTAAQTLITNIAKRYDVYNDIARDMRFWKYTVKFRSLALYDNNTESIKAWHNCHPEITIFDVFRSNLNASLKRKALINHLHLFRLFSLFYELKEQYW